MKTKFIQIHKTEDLWLKEGIQMYTTRIKRYIPFESKEIEAPAPKGRTKEQILEAEANKVLSLISPADHLVLLDDKGQSFSSEQFAVWLNKKFTTVNSELIFLVGGAYGFHESIRKRANESISLSSMTFTHQMVRLIFTEQFYRALTILRNEPYHHS